MFDAPCCIYNALFKTVCDDFLALGNYTPGEKYLDESEKILNPDFRKIFRNVERGIPRHLTQGQSLDSYFPACFFEWGSISEIKPYQSPLGFTYDLVVPLNVLTFIGEKSAVFAEVNSGYGIGDMVSLVTQRFWAEHYPGRFMKAHLFPSFYGDDEDKVDPCPKPEIPSTILTEDELRGYCEKLKKYDECKSINSDWNIIDFSLSVGHRVDPGPGEVGIIADYGNPFIRGTTVYFKFHVFERDALI